MNNRQRVTVKIDERYLSIYSLKNIPMIAEGRHDIKIYMPHKKFCFFKSLFVFIKIYEKKSFKISNILFR